MLSGGTSTMNGGLRIASGSGTGAVTQTAGSAVVQGGLQFGTGTGTGTYTLSGGTLTRGRDYGRQRQFQVHLRRRYAGRLRQLHDVFDLRHCYQSYVHRPGGGTDTVTWNSMISGVGGLNKTGTGTLTLSAVNSYTGITAVNAGTLQLSGSGTLGGITGSTTVSGGTLDLGATSQTQNGGVTLSGGTIQNGTLSSSGTFALSNGTVSAVLAGSGGVAKTGADTVTLSGANTYTGGTTVSAGTLQLSGSGTLGSTSGSTTVSGGTLDLGGTSQTQNGVTLSGGTIQNGTLSSSGSFALSAGTLSAVLAGSGGVAKSDFRHGDLVGCQQLHRRHDGQRRHPAALGQRHAGQHFRIDHGVGRHARSRRHEPDTEQRDPVGAARSRTARCPRPRTSPCRQARSARRWPQRRRGQERRRHGVLSGTNTYTGGTTVSAGTLGITSNASLGNGGIVRWPTTRRWPSWPAGLTAMPSR